MKYNLSLFSISTAGQLLKASFSEQPRLSATDFFDGERGFLRREAQRPPDLRSMESTEALQAILRSYRRYYTVREDGAPEPFAAEAEFHAHGEQYFLVRAAKVADIDSNEYVFFAREESVDEQRLLQLAEAAWSAGLARVHAGPEHRNSDITLIVVAGTTDGAARAAARKCARYKSYRLSFWGWSHFRLVLCDLSTGCYSNRMGADARRSAEAALRQSTTEEGTGAS